MYQQIKPLEDQQSITETYFTLRKAVGFLGILLPLACFIGSFIIPSCEDKIHKSISDYYFTPLRDIFVGILSAVAFFLFAYKGFGKLDFWMAKLGALAALGVAFFPTTAKCHLACNINYPVFYEHSGIVHLSSALALFSVLIYFCLVSFKNQDPNEENLGVNTTEKIWIYKFCGYLMLVCVILIGLYFKFIMPNYKCHEFPVNYNIVFWLETFALAAFGISWTVKGNFVWRKIIPFKY
jgi:hypothetical protein